MVKMIRKNNETKLLKSDKSSAQWEWTDGKLCNENSASQNMKNGAGIA